MCSTEAQQRAGSEPRNGGRSRYILIVDDETPIIRSLTRELDGWARSNGYSVSGTVIGRLALDFIEEHRNEVDLVIADIRMPGMSGGDMALEIKKRYPDIKIIVLTAYNDTKEIRKAHQAGISSFMTKPWDTEHLIHEIEQALS
ncbi:MAG: response regulator [Spirochaetota bacterium]